MRIPDYLLALLGIDGLSFQERRFLYEMFDSSKELYKLKKEDVSKLIGRPYNREIPSELERIVSAQAEYLEKHDVDVICYDDFPQNLKEIYDPPFVLFKRGADIPDDTAMLAVVGTRRLSFQAREGSAKIGRECAGLGVPLVSGLALGVDCTAQRACVKAGGYTVAVLGSGIDDITPRSNRPLGMDILEQGGCIISEYAPGIGARKYQFPQRNRIIAGLATAVLLIEAPEKSGALITVDFALQEGRDVFTHKSGAKSKGVELLKQSGAAEIESVHELASILQVPEEKIQTEQTKSRMRNADVAELLLDELNILH